MMATIAFVAIFSAILVFFVDELFAYAKKLAARPYALLLFSLLLASALIEMYEHGLLWTVVTLWIGLLLLVQWVAQHLFFSTAPAAQFFAKLCVVIVVAMSPVGIAYLLDMHKKRRLPLFSKSMRNRGQAVGVFFWMIMVLLLSLGPPGSDFSG